MAPAADLMRSAPRQSAVLIDVTSLISAEEFVLAHNNRRLPHDPFGRQSYVEVIQSLIFMSRVYIVHPSIPAPRTDDFGTRPRLLQALASRGLVTPLRLNQPAWALAQSLESLALQGLQSVDGFNSIVKFVTQARLCDKAAPRADSLSDRVRGWSQFQVAQVYPAAGHHDARIQTSDGIEDDEFGQWVRAATIVLRRDLAAMAAPGAEALLMAALARSIKYRARADAAGLSYQSHPMRRDFLLTFDLMRDGAGNEFILDVIKVVRGIHTSLLAAGGESFASRLRIVELELPLLGGRLWDPADVGKLSDEDWIEFVADKVADYRERASDLRQAIEGGVGAEDHLRLMRDIAAVQDKLIGRLGLRSTELSPVERELMNSVASVTQGIPGVPTVSGLWIGVRSAQQKYAFSGQPFQRFLYKEFVKAWKRSGR